jgi:hypothetical protein
MTINGVCGYGGIILVILAVVLPIGLVARKEGYLKREILIPKLKELTTLIGGMVFLGLLIFICISQSDGRQAYFPDNAHYMSQMRLANSFGDRPGMGKP